jgi:trehalose/maltose hydrolase-like predicted phosphorylase
MKIYFHGATGDVTGSAYHVKNKQVDCGLFLGGKEAGDNIEVWGESLLMDLADVGGNVKDGCHIASMGGTWMMLTYGFGGMRDDDGTLSLWPRRAPEDNAILRFP